MCRTKQQYNNTNSQSVIQPKAQETKNRQQRQHQQQQQKRHQQQTPEYVKQIAYM